MSRWLLRAPVTIAAARLNLAVIATAYSIFGLSMLTQPRRWAATPAYHVLLQIFAVRVWGALFLAVGAGIGLAAWQFKHRAAAIAALMPALALTTGWMLAFIVRWLSSPNTTPETWVSWAVFLFLLLRVTGGLDRPRPPAVTAPPSPSDVRAVMDAAEAAYTEATGHPPHADGPR